MRGVLLVAVAAGLAAQTRGERAIVSESEVGVVAFAPDGTLAGLCRDGKVRQWDAGSGALKRTVAVAKGESGATLAPGSDVFATAGADGSIKLWNLSDGGEVRKFGGGGGPRV